jgi:uncharacterized protein (TIGR03437 family)
MPSRLPVSAALLIASLPAFSASLSAPDQVAARGEAVVASLAFSGDGQAVSAIQFDLLWDATIDVKIVIGDGLRTSSKILYTAPQGPRTIRCLVAGGIDPLPEGELLKLFLVVDQQAPAGPAQVRIVNLAGTAPDGGETELKPATVKLDVLDTNAVFISVPLTGILNAASLLPGPVSPGEIVTLIGSLPAGEVAALVNGVAAPILYRGTNQLNMVVPFGLDVDQPASLEIRIAERVAKFSIPVSPVAPGLFTQTATGVGAGAILNEDYTPNSADNPAARGSTVMLFGTGFGTLDPPPADGQPVESATPTRARVTAAIGNAAAAVDYAGGAPGLIAGVTQINVRVPVEVEPGAAAPVIVQAGGTATPGGVFIAIK